MIIELCPTAISDYHLIENSSLLNNFINNFSFSAFVLFPVLVNNGYVAIWDPGFIKYQ